METFKCAICRKMYENSDEAAECYKACYENCSHDFHYIYYEAFIDEIEGICVNEICCYCSQTIRKVFLDDMTREHFKKLFDDVLGIETRNDNLTTTSD